MKTKKQTNNKMPSTFGYKLLAPLMRPLFRLWYHPTVIGKENIPEAGALVVASNHIHAFDQCLTILSTRRAINFMAKKEYFEGKMKGFFRFVGCIPVNRDGRDTAAVMRAMRVLKNEGAIGIFPEGTRNKTEAFMLPFKPGAVTIAQKTGAAVLPVAVTGDYKFRSKNLTVQFGKPFFPETMETADANEKLRSEVEQMMHDNLSRTV